jgi:glycyl-tRNA synthetase beta chain
LIAAEGARGRVAALELKIPGRPAAQVLAEKLPGVLAGLHFPRSMRWGKGDFAFVRPVHWLCALLGNQPLQFEFAGVKAGKLSCGHRFAAPEELEVSPENYLARLNERRVVADPEERRASVRKQLAQLAASAGGRPVEDPGLEEEVTFLVEWPVGVLGSFDRRFLQLPREVLLAAMRNHQRYFALEDSGGRLLPRFVAFANTPVRDLAVVRHGFERVLVARLNDAEFFFSTDRRQKLIERLPALDRVVFQADLGSYGEKVRRLEKLAAGLMELAGLSDPQLGRRVGEAVRLCKTDLLTEMVKEFPELQGVMGSVYASGEGIDERVAVAIREHLMPRSASDRPPHRLEGALVGLADRLDTLAGCFGVGLKPSGAADPFALRRQCLAVITVVLEHGLRFSLEGALKLALQGVREKLQAALAKKAVQQARKRAVRKKQAAAEAARVELDDRQLLAELKDFFAGRLRQRFIEQEGARPDVAEAVLAAGFDDLVATRLRLRALKNFIEQPAFADLAVAFKRAANILGEAPGGRVDEKLFQQPEESALWRALEQLRPRFEEAVRADDFSRALELAAAALRRPVDEFFERVLVNDDQHPEWRQNRLSLLAGITGLVSAVADFSRLQLKLSG